MFIYHYHAQIQTGVSSFIHIDGILQMTERITNMDDYRVVKELIAEVENANLNPDHLVITSLSYLPS